MLYKHITINQLTNIECNYKLGINAYQCSIRMKIGKDKARIYYKKFQLEKTVSEIYYDYQKNKKNCGRQPINFTSEKLAAVNLKLEDGWSADVICGRDKLEKTKERCSTNTIYRMVDDGIIDKNKLIRKGNNKSKDTIEKRGKINNCKTIHERNATHGTEIENLEYGHFEGDTIVGANHRSAILTLVERKTKFMIMLKASSKSHDIETIMIEWLNSLEKGLVKTITYDRGTEFSRWENIENKASNSIEIYFADPGSPGQRGLNENNNGIIRRDYYKSTDLSVYSQAELNEKAMKWNNIPRRSLNYYTPVEVLKKCTNKRSLLLVG